MTPMNLLLLPFFMSLVFFTREYSARCVFESLLYFIPLFVVIIAFFISHHQPDASPSSLPSFPSILILLVYHVIPCNDNNHTCTTYTSLVFYSYSSSREDVIFMSYHHHLLKLAFRSSLLLLLLKSSFL